MQILEEEKTKLDAFCEQSLKNVSFNQLITIKNLDHYNDDKKHYWRVYLCNMLKSYF